jgi:hypothetical protein
MKNRNRNTTQKIIKTTSPIPFKFYPVLYQVAAVFIWGLVILGLGWIVWQAPRDVFFGVMCMGLGYVLGMRHKERVKPNRTHTGDRTHTEQTADETKVNDDGDGGG